MGRFPVCTWQFLLGTYHVLRVRVSGLRDYHLDLFIVVDVIFRLAQSISTVQVSGPRKIWPSLVYTCHNPIHPFGTAILHPHCRLYSEFSKYLKKVSLYSYHRNFFNHPSVPYIDYVLQTNFHTFFLISFHPSFLISPMSKTSETYGPIQRPCFITPLPLPKTRVLTSHNMEPSHETVVVYPIWPPLLYLLLMTLQDLLLHTHGRSRSTVNPSSTTVPSVPSLWRRCVGEVTLGTQFTEDCVTKLVGLSYLRPRQNKD